MVRMRSGVASWLLLVSIVAFTGAPWTAWGAANQDPSLASKLGSAFSSMVKKVKGETFTIVRIESRLGEGVVNITFSDQCNLAELRNNLKLTPALPAGWAISGLSADNVLTLQGGFTPGQRYAIVLPKDFKSSNGRLYLPGVAAFTFPKQLGEAATVLQFSQGPTFTIAQIEGLPKERQMRVQFTDRCEIASLRRNLKFLPPVPVAWHNSNFSKDNILTLPGNFKPGQKYVLVLPEQFKSDNDRAFTKGVMTFTMPDLPSQISYLERENVIERDSRQMLHVQLQNVNEVQFKGLRVPPLLIPTVLKDANGKFERPWEEMQAEYTKSALRLTEALAKEREFLPFTGAVTAEGQLFFDQAEQNILHQFSIPLTFREGKEKGALELINIVSTRKGQVDQTTSRLYRITDIGLTYKVSANALLVWATSLHSGQPLEGVELLAFTRGNEAVALGQTGADGLLSVANDQPRRTLSLKSGAEGVIASKPLALREVTLVAAASLNDQSYIEIQPRGNLPLEGIEQVSPEERRARSLLKGYVFTERGIYRPGDVVMFKGTVREYHDGTIAPPVSGNGTFTIKNSKQEEVYKKELKLSGFGTASDRFEVKPFFPLGTYTLHLKYGPADEDTVSRSFEVQEFRQPRHYVEVLYKRESKKDDRYVNLPMQQEILNCEIGGKYYAGGPVKHGKVRWTIYQARTDYNRPDYQGYSFGYPLEGRSELIESGESMLDENGRLVVPVPLSKEVLAGRYGIEVVASVVDFDGRASSDSAIYQGDPAYLVGISSHPALVQAGVNQLLQGVVIDKQGRKVGKGTVSVQVLEKGWTQIQKRNAEGSLFWEQQQVWRKHLAVELPIKDELASFEFDFAAGGDFLVSFGYKGEDGREYTSATEYHVSGEFYSYEHRDHDQARSFERLSMSVEKPLYGYGETIKLYLNPHRPLATCLVSIEQGNLVEYYTVQLKPGQRTLELPVKDAYAPNVYISVLGTVPRQSFPQYAEQFDAEAPTFLFGTVNVEVKGGQQAIRIGVNEKEAKLKALPGAELTLTVVTRDQAGKGIASEVALCVVDESILAMTGYETPVLDSLAKFITPLGVFTGELRTDLLKQTPYGFFRNAPLTGGDGEEGKAPEAATSKVRKDFSPVAYFNPALLTDDSGSATFTVKFPDTMTTYRIYAVACDKGSRFGSFQRSALVVKDFYLEPGLPAFMTSGDRFTFQVAAFNKTDRQAPVALTTSTDKLLTLATASDTFALAGFDRTLIPVTATVKGAGTTQLTFAGKFRELSDTVELKLPVNSGHVLASEALFGNFHKEAKVNFALPKEARELKLEELGPNEARFTVTVSGSPFLRMTAGLRYLLHYPYGCVEQTSSGVLPLAALRSSIKKGLLPGITIEETDKFIKPGIDRLFSMQTASGGFGYWPGDLQPHPWGTVYALTALTKAKMAGIELPKDRMDKALAYLHDALKASGGFDATYRSYAAYLLAQNGRLDKDTFNYVYEGKGNNALLRVAGGFGQILGLDQQPREAAMLTLMAGKIAKHLPDATLKSKLRPILEKPWNWSRSDEFYAQYREPAIAVLAATMIFPKDELTDRLAARLMGGMSKEGIWTSTSDTSWSLIALSEYFTGAHTDGRSTLVTIRQGERVVESFTLDPKESRTVGLDPAAFLKNPAFTITAGQDQALLYKLEAVYPRIDYGKNGYSNGLEIHKSIRNTDGSNRIKLGDIVEVKLKINIKQGGANYVVIDDPLPAGFVAINSAIKTEEQIVPKHKRKVQQSEEGEGDGEGESEEGDDAGAGDNEFGTGFTWSSDYYWDPAGFYRFAPNFFEIRNDRVLAFKNRAWQGIYEYSYYARAVCEGEFVLPSSKVQLMYDPEVAGYTPQGKVVIYGK